MEIDQNLIKKFRSDGAVCIRNVFSEKWINLVREGIEKNLKSPSVFGEKLKGDQNGGCYFDDYCNWTRFEEFRDFAFHSPAAEVAGILTESEEVSFYHEHVLVKEPGSDKETPWHHDQSYYPIDGEQVCSIWMPVDPIPQETCVKFVAGSHKWGWFRPVKFETTLPYQITRRSDGGHVYQPVPDIRDHHDVGHDILSWELRPGDCIVFHMKCLHGAPGNVSSTTSRRVLSTRWLGDDAVIAVRPWITSPPTCGGLEAGQKATSEEFPLVWKRELQ